MDTLQRLDMRSLRSLEWERLKSFVAKEALSSAARQACLDLGLMDERHKIEEALAETDECFSLIENGADPLNDAVPDIIDILERLGAGSRCQPEELLSIRNLLTITKRVGASLRLLEREDFPWISSYCDSLTNLDSIRKSLEQCLDEKGDIKDDASSTLRNIRNSIRKLHGDIKRELSKLMHSSQVSKALQETIITQRSGRYVLPVSASKRNDVNGIVHDSSQSGLTVYIEPMSVVEPTNRIRILEADEVREIERILDELSQLVRSEISRLMTNFETLTHLDVVQAKAKLAIKYDGIKPELSPGDNIELIHSRHPLLVLQGGGEVVANNLTLGGEERTLVITGPNTGGKTVLLKQVGLAALMVKAGLLLPARQGTKFPVFNSIWADIGDEQSLEQSLSTFSSHLQNVVSIVEASSAGTLILLDEIGVGTDPKEGAAIAQSVLEKLNDSGAITVTTTHYTDLKMLGYSKEGFVNGSLEFNEATFAPTYKLRLGMPGSSKGIVIAERLGLMPDVVARAREIIDQEDEDRLKIMGELESRLLMVASRESELDEDRARLKSETDKLSKREEKLDRKADSIEAEFRQNLDEQFRQTEGKIKELTRELQRRPSLKKTQEIKKKLEEIKSDLNWTDETPPSGLGNDGGKLSAGQLSQGTRVLVRSLNQKGLVDSINSQNSEDTDFEATVIVGSLKVKVSGSDLKVMEAQGSNKKKRGGTGRSKFTERKNRVGKRETAQEPAGLSEFIRTSVNTLDLRGKRVDEALTLVDHFLDQCLVSSVSPVMIIHGHGTGAIKSAVRDYLKSSRYSRDFRPGEMHEGGDGTTVVNLG